MEIRRLIEARRSTSKVEKQRQKDLRKQIKMHQGQEKSKNTGRDCANTRRLQQDQEHSRNQICKKKSTHHQDNERQRRANHIKEGHCQCLWGSLQKYMMTKNTKKLNWNTKRMRLNESSIDEQSKDTSEMKRIPEITIEELQTAINRLKKKRKISRKQWNQSRRHQSLRRRNERDGETDLQRDSEAK